MNLKRDKFPIIPGYHLETVLGRGATGVVYRATQLSVKREVALKVLRSELVGTSKAVQRLQREARNTARLHHPNIISAIDMGEISGRWWYAMELVGGPSLAAHIKKKGALTEREALRTFPPLAAALQHLYEEGIVHRDVKPANIVLEEGGRALLIDLGLAFSEEDASITRSGGTLGTPHYISPEQARDPSSADVRSDIWSLGATMYHAVCGEPPFAGESVAEIMSRVLYSRIPDPHSLAPNLSRGYALVLRKCLARSPGHRYQTPQQLQDDLELLRERRAPQVSRSELDPLLRAGKPRWHLPVAAAGVLFVGGAVWLAAAKPWEVNQQNPVAPELTEWKPLEEFAALPAPATPEIGARYYELLEITQSTPSRFLPRANELRGRLESQLESELANYKRKLDRQLDTHFERSEFREVRTLLREGAARGLEVEFGLRFMKLPELRKLEFGNWLEYRTQRLAEAVEQREIQYRTQAELHLENTRRDVGALQERQNWESARRLVGENFQSWLEGSGAEGAGLTLARKGELVSAVSLQHNLLRQRFDNAWYDTDRNLKRFVTERARELARGVESREVQDPRARLESDFAIELRRLGLTLDAMPAGLSRYAVEEASAQASVLAEQASRLAEADARAILRGLQNENEASWRSRDYAAIVADLELRIASSGQREVREALSSVLGEAQRLQAFLERAARGVADRDGERMSLAISGGSIQVTGKVRAGTDPLARGFGIDAARDYQFSLVGPVAKPNHLVTTRDLRVLAGAGVGPQTPMSSDLRLATALFLYREGDALEALAVLFSGEVPEDSLVQDLDDRIHAAILHKSEGEDRDRAVAKHDLQLLRNEWKAPHDSQRLLDKCHLLVTSLARFLSPEELVEVRTIQATLRRSSPAESHVDELQRLFGPNELELVGPNRVRMAFRFDEPDVGAWEIGEWQRSAFGWDCPAGIPSIVAHPGPSLILRKPLDVSSSVVELNLEIEQVSPSRVFAISAVGFHVVFTGGDKPRCLVHSGSIAEANALAAEGEGRRFSGFERDERYSLRFEFNKASGDVKVWVDGKKLDRRKDMRSSPSRNALSNSITISSIDPLRVMSAVVEAWHE